MTDMTNMHRILSPDGFNQMFTTAGTSSCLVEPRIDDHVSLDPTEAEAARAAVERYRRTLRDATPAPLFRVDRDGVEL